MRQQQLSPNPNTYRRSDYTEKESFGARREKKCAFYLNVETPPLPWGHNQARFGQMCNYYKSWLLRKNGGYKT